MAASRNVTSLSVSHLRPLAAWLITAFALSSPPAQAIVFTIPVLNCSDHDANSLRNAVGSYPDGYVIDMTALACSTISLTTGAIFIGHNVTLAGPADHTLTITGNDLSRVLVHYVTGTLTLDHLTLTHGKVAAGTLAGGCIYSYGSVALQHSTVSNCTVQLAFNGYTGGGGIFAARDLTLTSSVLSGSQMINSGIPGAYAAGGGAFVKRNFTANLSTVRDNLVLGSGTPTSSFGGGVDVQGTSQVYGTTLSGNQASIGGAFSGKSATFENSTVSENYGAYGIGGIYARGNATLTLNNSTIAFNTHKSTKFGAGVWVSHVLVSSSSIIANNTSTQNAKDYSLFCASGCSFAGSHNLITASQNGFPIDTITLDPKLSPLADNGGTTRTHALKSGSPAIDAGANIHDYPFDQRGTGHARGIGANPDIGAFELDSIDLIFSDGFG